MGSFRKQSRISLPFLALGFIQLLWLQEATVLRMIRMFELLFLINPSDSDTSSTYFQVRDSGSGIFNHYQEQYRAKFCSLGNTGCYWEPVRGRAS